MLESTVHSRPTFNKYEQFLVSNTTQKKPTRLDVAERVAYVWGEIRRDSIINSWYSIGIKNQSRIIIVDEYLYKM